jgi:hypothetical protein
MLPTPGRLSLPGFRRLCRRFIGSAVLTAVALTPASAATPDPWQAARNFDHNAASLALAAQHAAQPADLRIATAYAASLLVRQPHRAAHLDTARTVLESVIARATPADLDHLILARYLLARLDHEHVAPPRLDAARRGYTQLVRDHPGHPLAGHAAVHLGFLHAFQTPGLAPADAVAFVEELLGRVTTPGARRELHHLAAHLHWRERHDAAAALPHYQAGRAIGFETPYRDGELDLTIAGLAAETGQHALAVRHYRAFADAYPRDARTQTVRRLAAENEARLATAP